MPEATDTRPHVLVTGGAGFIGAYAALDLHQRGATVTLADLRPPSGRLGQLLAEVPLEYVQLDVTDREQTGKTIAEVRPTAVVHGAALVNPVQLLDAPEEAADINVAGTVNVIGAAARAAVGKLVYLSSISVLPRPQTDPITVDHPLLLSDHGPGGGFYGASKIAGEAFCHAAIDGLGLDCSIVRPSAVYGFGMSWGMGVKELVEGVVEHGSCTIKEHGRVPRDFTYVKDVAALVGTVALHRGLRQRAFYGATGSALVTLEEIATVVREIAPTARVDLVADVSEDDVRESSYRGLLDVTSPEIEDEWRPSWSLTGGLKEYLALERRYAQATTTREDT